MKKSIACLLTAALILNMGFTANATTPDAQEGTTQEETSSISATENVSEGDGETVNGQPDQPAYSDIGQVTVSIGAAMELISPVTFSVNLTDSQGRAVKAASTVTIGGKNETDSKIAGEDSVCFEGLARGEYTLTVSAKGFATYTQNVQVQNQAYRINLMTGFLEGISYEEGASHPGVLLVGDVNGDGRIDLSDRTKLVSDIDGGKFSESSDLNGDGKVDLVDLEYFTNGYNETRNTRAKEEISISPGIITSAPGAGTMVEGNLENVLKGSGSVFLRPENGAEISPENPVVMEFDFNGLDEMSLTDGLILEAAGDNHIRGGMLTLTYVEDGNLQGPVEIPVPEEDIHYLLRSNEGVQVERHGGAIWIRLGEKVAVKKVTFTITGMTNNNNLAEISKVEFVNGMAERIPDPEMDIPENLSAASSSKKISLTWDACVNVTGYEVLVKQGDRQETVMVRKNAFDLTSFGGRELTNYLEYQIRVQSVNGTWRSGYGQEVSAVPKPNGKPDKPDGVSARGKYQSIVISWKNMKDTLSYNLYYKEKDSTGDYQKIGDIQKNSYTLQGLKDLTEYVIYVTGVNEFGESAPSLTVSATTTDMNPAVVPKYNLINTGTKGEPGAHIVSVTANGKMYDSPLDTKAGTAWGTVDHDPVSYYYKGSWDDGGYNPMGSGHGLTYEFDQAYQMDTIALQEIVSQDMAYSYAKVRYWDADGVQRDLGNVSVLKKTDTAGRVYYVLKLPEAVRAKKIQFGLARYLADGNVPITVSEVYFYYYDTLMDEIMALYEDDLHTVLRGDVKQADIDALRTRINTVDPVSGEYHPDRELLEKELQTAEAILKDSALKNSVKIYTSINTKDVNRGFGGLNAWQPLGVTAAAQEELMVYVGHNTKKTGESTNLQLIATQYHAESGSMYKEIATLKVGANKITVPKLWSTTEVESGGALYVQYTGNNAADQYAVRVSGGVQVPVLDLYQVTEEEERLTRAEQYIQKLQTYVSGMEKMHGEVHKGSANSQVDFDYAEQNCILGASDIMLDTMMLSLPAKQILAGCGSGTTGEQARKLLASMDAMEEMMYLFYQHKGLNASAEREIDRIPNRHLNIRYQRMFSGAFMYAAGNHIGIEWGSATGMIGATPVQTDSQGKYISGSYFGWGIAHEIGHCINQGAYAVAEVTNNYYAVLAQAKDTNGSVRFQYEDVYRKVTSGTRGAASNVFTQLGMYWQLHLAYDDGYNFKTYADYEEQLDHLFFARVDTYARTPSRAPAPGGVALTLAGDTSQQLMRLSCAASEKNLLEFFERWGMSPDAGTRAYAEQFAKETRAIYYVCDDSRVYSLQGSGSILGTLGNVTAVGDDVRAVVNEDVNNQIDISLGSRNIAPDDILGYEIVRCTIAGGVTEREAVGFTTGNSFSDTLPVNNRVVWYEITLIDKYLNRSAVKTLEPLKMEHDGSLEKDYWTVSTKGMAEKESDVQTGTEDSPCEPPARKEADKLIDNNVSTVFGAIALENAEILIEFNKTLTVTGMKYMLGESSPGGSYEIQVCTAEGWIPVAEGAFGQEKMETIYFENQDQAYVNTYAASAVKLIFKEKGLKPVSMAELDVLGVTGDNVDFARTGDGVAAIGKLENDYRYGDGNTDVIPAGSIIFTGSYKGNPAYNVVVLYDQDGNIVGGTDAEGNLKARQIILADVPAEGELKNVWNGIWIYWIEPGEQSTLGKGSKVRAELYRVNDAQTNEGQRLVSDSLFETVPGTLPVIEFGN